jgi:chemotaxis protein MotB
MRCVDFWPINQFIHLTRLYWPGALAFCTRKSQGEVIGSAFPEQKLPFWTALVCVFLLAIGSGCNRSNPYLTATPSGFLGPTGAPVPSPDVTAQIAELERRARLLDENNRQLTTQLAQSQQQMQLFRERSELMQRQVQDVGNQLQQSRLANAQSSQQLRGLSDQVQSVQSNQSRKGGAKLTANTSNRVAGEPLRDLGYPVEDEGGVIRLRVPADQLFQPGSAQLTPSAASILDRIAESLRRSYPKQRIAIEGHTDNSTLYGGAFASNHQLAAAQSNAVLDHFTKRNQMPSSQLFTLAHGENYPLGDNQSPTSRASNRRIEFVIYSESF